MSESAPAAKRRKPNFEKGVEYWSTQEASNNGVLGGFGNGTLPRVDALGSRLFLLTLLPELSTITPMHHDANTPRQPRPLTRAIDCGAGIGRVTSSVLLHLVDRVDLVEPTPSFVAEAARLAPSWRGVAEATKGVRIWQRGLQDYDPGAPEGLSAGGAIGAQDGWNDAVESGYDVVMVQWCIGHLSNAQMVRFLERCRKVLRRDKLGNVVGLICVKENVTFDDQDLFDEQDSSWTRADATFKACLAKAGLSLVREDTQHGLPEGLFRVAMYALR